MCNEETLKNRLSEKAVAYWQVEEVVTLVVTVVLLGGLLGLAVYFSWWSWLIYIFAGLLVLCVGGSIYSFSTFRKKFKHWSYAYDERFFYIREGVLTKRYMMLPFEKIQGVILTEGPLLNHFGLATIELQGIEKVYCIPALEKAVALKIQQELAELTRQKEEDRNETVTATHCL